MKLIVTALLSLFLFACSNNNSKPETTTPELLEQAPINPVQLMPKEMEDYYKALLPRIDDMEMQFVIWDSNTMWYDDKAIVPGYQDSQGDPEGMRPNTIDRSLIDTAVPGGHAKLFSTTTSGRFNFPFGTGGADRSINFKKVNFWSLPDLPVVYWKMPFSRWRWLFPKGTIFGEVMLIKFPDGTEFIFEVRTRKRLEDSWESKTFRPFPTAKRLADDIKKWRPDWNESHLKAVVEHLEKSGGFSPATLETRNFQGTFDKVTGYLDVLPVFNDLGLVKQLLMATSFELVTEPWKKDGDKEVYALSAGDLASIVPINYDSGLLPMTNESCDRCHKDAGRQIGDFQPNLILYGELWGEDQIFSWHPFENSMFVDANGRVKNFNNDNRRLRQDFKDGNLVVPYDSKVHVAPNYKEIPKSWSYRPI